MGFFPIVGGEDVTVAQAGAFVVGAKNDLDLRQGGAQIIGAGKDMEITQGGGWVIGAGNRVTVDQGGALVAAGRKVDLSRSYVGLALGKDVSIDAESKLVLGSSQSLAVGLVVGFLGSLLVSLFRRKST